MQGVVHAKSTPVAEYDPQGVVFAAGVDSQALKLYDIRQLEKVQNVCLQFYKYTDTKQGPFSTFQVGSQPGNEWTGAALCV